jgi:hypothetical protein
MKKIPYEEIWFTLDDYLKDNTFGKPYLSTVPPKWKKEFTTVTEMYNTIMLDIQYHINLYFNELFSHIDVKFLPINKVKLIKNACYSTFVSKLYGMLITNKNIKQIFSNNSGYSIEEDLTRDTNHYLDIFTPDALKALNATQIKQMFQIYKNWEEVFAHIKDKNFDYIYTAAEIDELIQIIKIESVNLFKQIAAYVEDRLDKYKTELANDKELINNISTSLVENEELVNSFEEKLETKFTEKLDEIEDEIIINKNKINDLSNLLIKSTPPIIRVPTDFDFDKKLWEKIDDPIKIEKLKISPNDIEMRGSILDSAWNYKIKNIQWDCSYYFEFSSRVSLSNNLLFGKNRKSVSQLVWTNDIETYGFFNAISSDNRITTYGNNSALFKKQISEKEYNIFSDGIKNNLYIETTRQKFIEIYGYDSETPKTEIILKYKGIGDK